MLPPPICRGIGRQPIYVDLEADPKIDKDNPPDLKQYADTFQPPPKDEQDAKNNSSSSSQTPAAAKPAAAAGGAAGGAKTAAAAAGKGGKKAAASSSSSKGSAQQSNDEHHIRLTNVVQRTGDIIEMVRDRPQQLQATARWGIRC